jgi:hypothetical protein
MLGSYTRVRTFHVLIICVLFIYFPLNYKVHAPVLQSYN